MSRSSQNMLKGKQHSVSHPLRAPSPMTLCVRMIGWAISAAWSDSHCFLLCIAIAFAILWLSWPSRYHNHNICIQYNILYREVCANSSLENCPQSLTWLLSSYWLENRTCFKVCMPFKVYYCHVQTTSETHWLHLRSTPTTAWGCILGGCSLKFCFTGRTHAQHAAIPNNLVLSDSWITGSISLGYW